MKKIICVILTAVLLIFTAVPAVYAEDSKVSEYSFFISIYNDIDRTYSVNNTKMTISTRTTVSETLELLKQKKLITDYMLNDNELLSISLKDKKITAQVADKSTSIFYLKINGKKQAIDEANHIIKNGDIIEWIYSDVTEDVFIPETVDEALPVTKKASLDKSKWTDKEQNILESGCEYLNLNQENSNFYIVALGCAGKSADVKMVNDLLSNIRQTQNYNSPVAIAKNILSLTFCGYDSKELVTRLSDYEDIQKIGTMGAINALIAYDSKNYEVADSKLNSRDKLIRQILDSQAENGGVPISKGSKEDVDATSMSITALSPYIERENVKAFIDKAVEYILANQTKTGGFGFMGNESSESLSQVIIALSSVGIHIDDARFLNKKRDLVTMLLEYRNDDGGFSHIKGEVSNTMATEQAVIALSAVKNNSNPYKMTKSVSLPPQTKTMEATNIAKEHPLRTIMFISMVLIIVVSVVAFSIVKTHIKKSN